MKQIYHNFELWEEYHAGMWRKESRLYEERELPKAISFTSDHVKYGGAMLEVVENWKYSCENNLSNLSINRKAWIGHAACCYKHGWPEYLVRRAWWNLTEKQRNLADKQALNAIKVWEQKQRSLSILEHGKTGVMNQVFQIMLQMS
jgi:hypothetical protein